MNTINGNFTQKTFDPNKTTIKLNPGGGEIEMLFKYLIEVINGSDGSFLKLDSNVSVDLQAIKDASGNVAAFEISTTQAKATKTLSIGSPSDASSGTLTIQGGLSGQAFYDRSYTGTGTATIHTFYGTNGEFYLYRQIGGVGANIMSFDQITGYGKFINGTLFLSKTTAEINAVVTPPISLTFWNTDLKTLCFYDGAGWKKVTHTAM